MITVLVIAAILGWAGIAFGIAAVIAKTTTDGLGRDDAHIVAWLTAFWPITLPLAAAIVIIILPCIGIAKLGEHYINFLTGKKKPKENRVPIVVKTEGTYWEETPEVRLCGSGSSHCW